MKRVAAKFVPCLLKEGGSGGPSMWLFTVIRRESSQMTLSFLQKF